MPRSAKHLADVQENQHSQLIFIISYLLTSITWKPLTLVNLLLPFLPNLYLASILPYTQVFAVVTVKTEPHFGFSLPNPKYNHFHLK